MDAAKFKLSLDELMATFDKRMEAFEGKLQQPTTSNNDELAAEFASFKQFIVSSLKTLQSQIECLSRDIDQLEMRGRRKVLLIHGLPESSNEDTVSVVVKAVTQQLKQDSFTATDISRCHRMGRASNPSKPRPILCKFKDCTLRDKIWTAKTNLKGTGTTITEFLTKTRHSVFMAARQCFGVSKCWTREGNVYVVGSDGSRHRIVCQADLDEVSKEASKPATSTEKGIVASSRQRRAARK